jgi:inosose dehydratase
VEAVRRLGKGVEYLHFKDIDSTRLQDACRRELGFLDGVRAGVFTTLGSGSVSFPGMLAELKKIEYDGWVIVEQDVDTSNPAAPSPFESARTSREYLRGLGI